MWTYKGIKVHWLGHDSFVLEGSRTVVIDPFQAKGNYKADVLLISHEHSDHLNEDDIRRFTSPSTTLLAPKICEGPLGKISLDKRFVVPGSKVEVQGISIEAVPAYNLNKFRESGKVFHPKSEERVGYVVTLDGVRFYHAGDTDAIPEMKSLDVDVSFLPVSGTYVMTADEAAGAARAMKTKVAVPMHYAKIVGSLQDAQRFKDLVGGIPTVEILPQE
ncbi:MAG: MBL fold metallo-hydrolase [Thaumarchaeota archaeon]|nr:MBL fold metallo-hydrolase [Nitrososphaerota archaeon]